MTFVCLFLFHAININAMMFVLFTLTLVLVSFIFVNYYKILHYWKRKGVKYVAPLPIFGNSLPLVLRTKSLAEFIIDLYQKYPNERYCGTFQYGQPVFLLRDLELIKSVMSREFDTFSEHPISSNSEDDPLWGKNLFASSGERWKYLRHIIAPVFTSSKIKLMFDVVNSSAQQLMDYVKEQDGVVIEIELNDIFRRYCTDVIASAAFGIKCNSFKDRDNEFIRMGSELTNFGGIKKLKNVLYTINPTFAKILQLKMHPTDVKNFFRAIVKTSIDIREKQTDIKHDFIHFLLETRKDKPACLGVDETLNLGTKNKQVPFFLSDDDITAQSLDFFYGGFYSTSSLMCTCMYELVVNPKIQDRLRKDIDENLQQNDGEINYDTLIKMGYLDMVILETVRKWPTVWIDRKSVKPFTIEPISANERPVHLEAGTICWIPVFAIQRDEIYWPNPEKFDPERFNDIDRPNIHASAFMPFGLGPRNCVGSKFALVQAKLIIFHILSRYEIVPIKKSVIINHLSVTLPHSFWFGFKKRIIAT